MNEYVAMWSNYANFTGRTTVRGYWMAYLVNFVIAFVIGFIGGYIPALSFLATIYTLAILIPSLSIMVRRLRDAGYHWAWIFISLIPIVGSIILIVLLCQKSKYNDYNNIFNP